MAGGNINQRLNGLNPLSYMGVNAQQPSNFIYEPRAPVSTDSQGFELGAFWLDTQTEILYTLVSLNAGVARWVALNGGGGGGVQTLTGNSGVATPDGAGNVNVETANANIVFVGSSHTLLMDYAPGTGVGGIILGSDALGAVGSGNDDNVGLGVGALASLVGGATNTAIGVSALGSLTNGNQNTAVGGNALVATDGDVGNTAIGWSSMSSLIGGGAAVNNTALGWSSLINLASGINNIVIGSNAGSAYVGAESNNIIIGHVGVAAENNTLRIGVSGNGAHQVDRAFIGGISGISVGSVAKVVTQSTVNDQLGTATITAGSGITISTAPNTITINATGGPGSLATLTGNTGGAVSPDGSGNIDIVTANTNINLAGNAGAHTLTLDFGQATGGGVILGTKPTASNNTNVGVGIGVLAALTSGSTNVAIGNNALDANTTASGNTAIGANSLGLVATNGGNTAVGFNTLTSFTGGGGGSTNNTALGSAALHLLVNGTNNIAIGTLAASAYTGAESSNNIIGHTGVLGESNTMRIGTSGGGAGQVNRAFIAGINGVTTSNSLMVTMNSATEQLGTAAVPSPTQYAVTSVNFAASPYTVLAADQYLNVDATGGAITLRFPDAAATGKAWVVKDLSGQAAANNITVTTVSGATQIDGSTSFVMNTNYESIEIIGVPGTVVNVYSIF